MSREDQIRQLEELAGKGAPPTPTGFVYPLDYKAPDTADRPPIRWSNGYFTGGIATGLVLPAGAFLILVRLRGWPEIGLFAIWGSLLFLTSAGGIVARFRQRRDGFLAGLLVGTLLSGGLCGLVQNICR